MKIPRQARTLKQRFERCQPRLKEAVLRVAKTVTTYPANPFGKKPRAFLVGGFVRDLLLGNTAATDADIEIYGIPAEILEAMLRPLFPEDDISTVGKTFGVIKISLGEGLVLDLALPRSESKISDGHRGFAVVGDPNLDPAIAAKRRDFTINTMSLDPLTGELVDPFHGAFDLEERILRVVDPETFIDDPLRALRAVQFVGRFGLTVEPKSKQLLTQIIQSPDYRNLSAERITEEWRKLFVQAESPSRGLSLAHEIGITDFPFTYNSDSCALLSRKHHLMSEDRLIAMLTTVFDTWAEDSLKETWHKTLFGRVVEESVEHLKRQLQTIPQVQMTPNSLRVFLKQLLPVSVESFFVAAEATGRLSPATAKRWQSLIAEHNLIAAAQSTLLRGQDLIELGLPAGPRIGALIDEIEQLRDQGKLETREQALQTVQNMIAEYAHQSPSKRRKPLSR